MKRKITVAIEKPLLRRARAIGARRTTTIGALLVQVLAGLCDREAAYTQAKKKASACQENPLPLGGPGITHREAVMTAIVLAMSIAADLIRRSPSVINSWPS